MASGLTVDIQDDFLSISKNKHGGFIIAKYTNPCVFCEYEDTCSSRFNQYLTVCLDSPSIYHRAVWAMEEANKKAEAQEKKNNDIKK